MEVIKEVFDTKKKEDVPALVTFLTAGYPTRDDTVPILLAMQEGGADIIELGVPFCPIADGPTIKENNTLAANTDIDLDYMTVLGQLREARKKGLTIPVLLMGYYNSLFDYGVDKSVQDASEAGANGFVVVDLPREETITFLEKCRKASLSYVPLIDPSTTIHAIKFLSSTADTFIYVVSKTTAVNSSDEVVMKSALSDIISRVRGYATVPLVVGSGEVHRDHFYIVGQAGANGVVVGSRLVNIIQAAPRDQIAHHVEAYYREIRQKGPSPSDSSPASSAVLSAPALHVDEEGPSVINSASEPAVLPATFGQYGGQYIPDALVDRLAELDTHKSTMGNTEKRVFPKTTTTILEVHTDEVWDVEWSHNGDYLASAGKDNTAIIWRIKPQIECSIREWTPHLILSDHPCSVSCLAWSMDDLVLLTGAQEIIKLWDTRTGLCIRSLAAHSEAVTALAWLPDGSGFISGGLDQKIIRWGRDGELQNEREEKAIRITDLAVTPDFASLVALGMRKTPDILPSNAGQTDETQPANPNVPTSNMIVYDLVTMNTESTIHFNCALTCKISKNSQYALIDHAPDIHLWDLSVGRQIRTFSGLVQERHVIRSCFGGIDDDSIVSGSEDGNIYAWHRDTGVLLEILSGHGEGSVNSVAWNPKNERMFASCSDDHTIRIWEGPHDTGRPASLQPSSSSLTMDLSTRLPIVAEQQKEGNGSTGVLGW